MLTPDGAQATEDTAVSLISVDRLQVDMLKYRQRRKYLERQALHIGKELELISVLEINLKQAYDYAKEAERELERYAAQPKKKKTITRTYPGKCCECLSDFMASWKGRKHCDACIQKNPRARAAQRVRRMVLAGGA